MKYDHPFVNGKTEAGKGFVPCPGSHTYRDRTWFGFWTSGVPPLHTTRSTCQWSVMLCGVTLELCTTAAFWTNRELNYMLHCSSRPSEIS